MRGAGRNMGHNIGRGDRARGDPHAASAMIPRHVAMGAGRIMVGVAGDAHTARSAPQTMRPRPSSNRL
jgi:hypothetical protein